MTTGSRLPLYVIAVLSLLAAAMLPGEARAQWAPSPYNGNNISNTNTGSVGVGTNNPGNYRIHVFGVGSSVDAMLANFFGTHNVLVESQAGVKVGLLNNYYGASGTTETVRGVVALGYSNGPGSNVTGYYSRQRVWHNSGVAQGVYGIAEADPAPNSGPAGQQLFGGHFEAKTTDTSGGNGNVAYGVYALGVVGASTNPSHSSFGVVARAAAAAGTDQSVSTYAVYADGTNSGAGRAYGIYSAAGTNYFSGNVGVGTASPGYRLDVQGGQLNASGGLCIAGDCRVSWSQVANGSGSTQWSTSGTSVYYNSGSVGIGAADPSFGGAVGAKLTVVNPGTAIAAAYSTGQLSFALNPQSNGSWTMYDRAASGGAAWTGGITQQSGNVGIGTGSPQVRLSVGGAGVNVYATDGWVERNLHVQGPEALVQGGGRGRLRVGSAWGYSGLYADPSSTGAGNDLVLGASSGTVRVGPGGGAVQNLSVANGDLNVSGTITGGNIQAKYQDVAEWVPSTQKLQAGTVVVLDAARTNHVVASGKPYDTSVAGVVSAEPGVILGTGGEGKLKVATTGRVKVRVDATRAPIAVGDLLVTSGVEGVAMKSIPVELGGITIHRPGTIIGKALEPLEKGTGEILVLLSLQ